jgi:hypothetical protein
MVLSADLIDGDSVHRAQGKVSKKVINRVFPKSSGHQVSQLVGTLNSRPAPEVVKVVGTVVEEVNNRARRDHGRMMMLKRSARGTLRLLLEVLNRRLSLAAARKEASVFTSRAIVESSRAYSRRVRA